MQTTTVIEAAPIDLTLRLTGCMKRPVNEPLIDRLRVIYLKYIHCEDRLSEQMQDAAAQFICLDPSKITQKSDVIKIAQECRRQFTKILRNNFDRAPLQEPVVIRDWIFEEWQLKDFIQLDQYFGGRHEAVSPFDQMPFPQDMPRHEFAEAIIELIQTIPADESEENEASGQEHHLSFQGSENCTINRGMVETCTKENDLFVAWQRYDTWLTLARKAVQVKKYMNIRNELKIDIAACKLANETQLHAIINQEAQRMLVYLEGQQQVIQEHIEEVEQARAQMALLKEQLDESTRNLAQLRDDLIQEEQRSSELRQQIRVEQARYARLAQEIQEIRNSQHNRSWCCIL